MCSSDLRERGFAAAFTLYLREGERALTAELDPSEVREARGAVRGLELARWDLYTRWYARGGSP